jgi:hypothetical protein
VNRKEIVRGAERPGVLPDELIGKVIVAVRTEADRIGIAGAPAAIA